MKKLILFAISFIAAALIFAVAVSSVPASLPFSDVPEDAWFYGAVADAYEAGLVKGKSGTVFAPDDNVTRAEVAAMLSRLDGTDVSEYGLYAAAFTANMSDGRRFQGSSRAIPTARSDPTPT